MKEDKDTKKQQEQSQKSGEGQQQNVGTENNQSGDEVPVKKEEDTSNYVVIESGLGINE